MRTRMKPNRRRSRRSAPAAAVLLAALLLGALPALLLSGCESDPATPPVAQEQPPALPDLGPLSVDVGFFGSGQTLAKAAPAVQASKQNFINAAVRVFAIDLVARLVLTPPVAAFGAALHSLPTRQDDGSWIWVYTCVQGQDELQIRLRGLRADDGVHWTLRVWAPQAVPPLAGEVWYEGITSHDGDDAVWTFHDPALPGDPIVAEVAYHRSGAGESLQVTCLAGEDEGDVIAFVDGDPEHAIEFLDASSGQQAYIRWNEATGTGSLQVPDYNGGERACWDEHQDDVDCD